MAIKMRHNHNKDAICCNCGNDQSKILDMFDVCIGDKKFTICDECNERLFDKTLAAEVYKNHRVKSPHDIAIINNRARRLEKSKNRNG